MDKTLNFERPPYFFECDNNPRLEKAVSKLRKSAERYGLKGI